MLQGRSAILPVGIIREDSIETTKTQVKLTNEEALLLNLKDCIKVKRGSFSDVEFLKIDYKNKDDSQKDVLVMDILCVEDIAEQKIVDVE